MTSQPLSQPRRFVRDGVTYLIGLPNWGQWLSILDRAARGGDAADQADVGRLLRLWIAASVEVEAGDITKPLGWIDSLPADLADELVSQGSAALVKAQDALGLSQTVDAENGGVIIATAQSEYRLRPLTFGERNACLSRNLHIHAGQPEVDASAYELALVAASLTAPDGPMSRADLLALPLSVGEALVSAARRLSDASGADELRTFAQSGEAHPDLELATLCLTYGMTPAEAMELPATTARRLHVAAGLLQAVQPADPMMPIEDDRVTKIVVHDD